MENCLHIMTNCHPGQLYFDFCRNGMSNLFPEEKALLNLLDSLDYSEFDRSLNRDAKYRAQDMIVLLMYIAAEVLKSRQEEIFS